MGKSKFYYFFIFAVFLYENKMISLSWQNIIGTGIPWLYSLFPFEIQDEVFHLLHPCQISWLYISWGSRWPCIRGWWLLSCAGKSAITGKLHSYYEVNIFSYHGQQIFKKIFTRSTHHKYRCKYSLSCKRVIESILSPWLYANQWNPYASKMFQIPQLH